MTFVKSTIGWLELESKFRVNCRYEELKKMLIEASSEKFVKQTITTDYIEYDYSIKEVNGFGQPGSCFSCHKSSEENGFVEIKYNTVKTYLITFLLPIILVVIIIINSDKSLNLIAISLVILLAFWIAISFSIRHISRVQLNSLERDLFQLLENNTNANKT